MKEIIAFYVSGEEYGVEISRMQSLENYQPIVPVPDAPECIQGTVRVRDEIYPVYDIKAKLGLPRTEVTEDTKILLLQTATGHLACVVDNLGDVFRVDGEDVQEFPVVAQTSQTGYVDFIARREGSLIVVVNPDGLLTEEQEEQIQKLDFSAEQEDE